MKILVVEDDKFLQNIYRVKLAKAGYEVKIAENGQEAFTAIAAETPDLILLDLVMPIMDGFTFLTEIKKKPGQKDIPIIIASNLGQTDDVKKALALGATDYIIKSDTALSELIAKILGILSKA